MTTALSSRAKRGDLAVPTHPLNLRNKAKAEGNAKKVKNLLLTGAPGVGKTSLLLRAVTEVGVPAGGFFTEEIREGDRRVGFSLTTLDGACTTLAHVRMSSPAKVGKYSVSMSNLERVGVVSVLRATEEAELVVVDEIGRMELLSQAFQQAVLRAFESEKRVLGTIMLKPHSFADALKARPDTRLLHLTAGNRQENLQAVVQWLKDQ